jgi:hypothetical protein
LQGEGAGEKGKDMVIFAATVVTAAISAVRVIIATFKCSSPFLGEGLSGSVSWQLLCFLSIH